MPFTYSLQFLITEYQKIRKEHGDKAKTTKWLWKNGYLWLINQIKKHNLFWNEFKKLAGFNDPYRKTGLSLDDLISEYQKIRAEHLDSAKSSKWMEKNGYGWLPQQVHQKSNLSWHEFKKLAGFDDPCRKKLLSLNDLIKEYQKVREVHGNKAKSAKWLQKNGYAWLSHQVNEHKVPWHEFKSAAGFDDESDRKSGLSYHDLIIEYQKIRTEHGDKARKCEWLRKNGYAWLYSQLQNKHKKPWDTFKKEAGFNDIPCHQDIFKLDDLILIYQKIRKKYGKKAASCEWLKDNKYGWLYSQVRKHNLSWNEFKKRAGFDEKLRPSHKKIIKSLKYQGFSELAIDRIVQAMKRNGQKIDRTPGTKKSRKAIDRIIRAMKRNGQ